MAKQFGASTIPIYLSLLAFTGWFALAGQFYLIILTMPASVPEIIFRYFTFFTILTNILVAVCCTMLVLRPVSWLGKFFSRPATLTAVTANILVVGIIYNLVLRWLWNPQGFQYVVDELLHLVIPIAFLIFWLVFVPKGNLKWTNIPCWLIYPLVYLVIVLIRGALSGYYPYPFLDVTKLGYTQTLLNCMGVAVVFVIISTIFVGVDKMLDKNQAK